ncbi:MAG: heme-binding domain-containing protein [Gemmataceae bacterium]|nr:heme-binding domain-containing protein [Gemmataceae bacterium]
MLSLLLLAAPTFNKDVAPILFNDCAACHRPGAGGPFPLLSYKDAKKRGKQLAAVTKSGQMPPWKAGKGDVALLHDRRLSEEKIAVFARWAEAGMPEGEAKDLPKAPEFPSEWALGKPDLVVKMPRAFKVPAEGRDIYRNFAVATGLTEDKWVRAIDFRPSARSVVHHTLFFLDPTGEASKKEKASGKVGTSGAMGGAGGGALLDRLRGGGRMGLGGWASGAQARQLPEGLAYKVPKGSDLILSTHFHPSGKAEEETSAVALYFADKPPEKRFMGVQLPFGFGVLAGIDIPAGKKDFTIEDSFVLPVDAKAFGASAHAHYIAKTFTLTATLPDGKKKTLLTIPDWDFAWQEQYRFQEMETLPKGTRLHVRITYDNSADNPRNPTVPPKRVRWGRESLDEMGSMTLQVVAAKESDFPALRSAYRKHVAESLSKRGKGLLGR